MKETQKKNSFSNILNNKVTHVKNKAMSKEEFESVFVKAQHEALRDLTATEHTLLHLKNVPSCTYQSLCGKIKESKINEVFTIDTLKFNTHKKAYIKTCLGLIYEVPEYIFLLEKKVLESQKPNFKRDIKKAFKGLFCRK